MLRTEEVIPLVGRQKFLTTELVEAFQCEPFGLKNIDEEATSNVSKAETADHPDDSLEEYLQ